MALKRPAPTDRQSNELMLETDHTSPRLRAPPNQNATNSHRSMMSSFQEQLHHQQYQQQTLEKTRTINSAAMTSSSFAIQSERRPIIKHWQDELMDFSTQLTRHAHLTLTRIENYFRANGMKFDTNFRNHFLYIANNR